MEKLLPLPLYSFLKIATENGGIAYKRLPNMAPWLLKTTLLEPLRWIELLTMQKVISEHRMEKPPIFILGYYRSGTTYLQQLFQQDERLGFTSAFQMIFPEIMLSCERWLTPLLEKVNRVFKVQNHIHRVPFTMHSTGEEDVAMSSLFKKAGAQWGYLFPGKMKCDFGRNVLLESAAEHEIYEWKTNYIQLLNKISVANKGKQLVLKNPPNTGRVQLLISLFPGAKFVFIKRNPYDLFASNKRLWEVVLKRYALGKDKDLNTSELILSTYSRMMDRYFIERTLIDQGNLTEISYEDLIDHPVQTMESIYQNLSLHEFEYCRNPVTRFCDRQRSYRKLDHHLSREENELVTKKWATYLEEFGYPGKL